MAPVSGQIWLLNLHYEANEAKVFERCCGRGQDGPDQNNAWKMKKCTAAENVQDGRDVS